MSPYMALSIGIIVGMVTLAILYVVIRGLMTIWKTLSALVKYLRDTVNMARQYDEHLAFFKEFMTQAQSMEDASEEAPQASVRSQSGSRKAERRQSIPPFPAPSFDRFPSRPVEVDSPPEDVDATGTDSQIMEADRLEVLRDNGYEIPGPEFSPKAVEVDSN